MLFSRAFREYMKRGAEADVGDAAPVGIHSDGSPCYTKGCARGGIPWKNIQKHNAKERAQMKFDFSGKPRSPSNEDDEFLRRIRGMEESELIKYTHSLESNPEAKEYKACLAELDRREQIYRDNWERANS